MEGNEKRSPGLFELIEKEGRVYKGHDHKYFDQIVKGDNRVILKNIPPHIKGRAQTFTWILGKLRKTGK